LGWCHHHGFSVRPTTTTLDCWAGHQTSPASKAAAPRALSPLNCTTAATINYIPIFSYILNVAGVVFIDGHKKCKKTRRSCI
jgi:hypothetical protein